VAWQKKETKKGIKCERKGKEQEGEKKKGVKRN
jgi:hypothetical protein